MPPRPRKKNIKAVEGKGNPSPSTPPPPPPPQSSSSSSMKTSTPRRGAAKTRISAACEACKRRKTRCTGEPAPCQLCQILGTECVIDLSQDMRRRIAMQQAVQDSKLYQESLDGLMDCIRDGESEVMQALQELFLRDNISKQETFAGIQQWTELVRSRGGRTTGGTFAMMSDGFHEGPSQEQQAIPGRQDTSSRDSFRSRTEDSPGCFRTLHNRLRECSEAEGERILAILLEADSISEAERNIPGDDMSMTGENIMESIDPELEAYGANLNVARMYWHPALQVGVDPLSSLSVPRASVEESSTSKRGQSNRQLAATPSSTIQSNSLFDPVPDASTSGVQSPRTGPMSTGQQHQSYVADSLARSIELHPAVNDLVVAKDQSGPHIKIPVHQVQTLLIPDDSFLSRVYTDYLNGAKPVVADGSSPSMILGSDDSIVVDLLFRDRRDNDKWDCSSWACDLCRGFGEFDLFVRLASVLMLTRLMQWSLVPSAENYSKLPDMMKPTPAQRMIPHIAAIDLIPFPCLRDAVIENLRDWLTPLLEATLSVNWPYFQDDAVEFDQSKQARCLTQQFIDHVSTYNNWSVGSQLLNSFPEVTGRVRLHN